MFSAYILVGLIGAALAMLWLSVPAGSLIVVLVPAFVIVILEWRSRLKQENAYLAAIVFNTSSNGIFITDRHNIVLAVNPAFTSITGYTSDEIVGRNPRLLSSGRHDRVFYAALWQAVKTNGMWQGEIWNRHKNGAAFVEWLTVNTVKNTQGDVTHHIAIFSDFTERKTQIERLEFLATHDPLTRLTNRTLFLEFLGKALADARRSKNAIAVLFLDIDNFKHVNDTLGHYVGDLLLQHVASNLLELLRAGDIVARQGGDEFIIALPNLALTQDASLLAEKILRTLEQPCELSGHTLKITASIGIALFPEDGTESEILLQNADTALYRAKQAGRNNYQIFNPTALKSHQ